MKTYEIFEENMERLSKRLKTIENKCNKYGCGFTFREVGETFKEVESEDGNLRTVRFVSVEVEGYELNLKAICSRAYCESRDFGLICSAVAAYARYEKTLEKKAADKQDASVSNWVGSEGDKIELKDASLSLLTSWDSEWGYVYLYKLTDKSGNMFTWKTGKWLGNMSNDLPQTISLKGTVKAHTEFRGIAQTELTRCRVA